MVLPEIARVIDSLATSFVLGATVWFFFVQSPVLLKRMGREKFVPLQMRLVVVLFRVLPLALLVMFSASVLHSPLTSAVVVTAAVALVGGLVNAFGIVPRALRAGGRSRTDIKGMDHQGSTSGFASEGAGNKTMLMHRLVVLFVVVMLGASITHSIAVLSGTSG